MTAEWESNDDGDHRGSAAVSLFASWLLGPLCTPVRPSDVFIFLHQTAACLPTTQQPLKKGATTAYDSLAQDPRKMGQPRNVFERMPNLGVAG